MLKDLDMKVPLEALRRDMHTEMQLTHLETSVGLGDFSTLSVCSS